MIFQVDRIETLSGKRLGTMTLFVSDREEANRQLLDLARIESRGRAVATKTAIHLGDEHWKIRSQEVTN